MGVNSCAHAWVANTPSGLPLFMASRRLYEGVRTGVRCTRCGAIEWMTREEWAAVAQRTIAPAEAEQP